MLPGPIATVPILRRRGAGGDASRWRITLRPRAFRRGAARWCALGGCLLLGMAGSATARPFSEPDDRNLDRHGHYRSRDGSEVHQPAKSLDGAKPAGATAKCRDGTWSFSHTHRGTCSRHGGVARWEG
ncbi:MULTISPECIES: DUF3761 domain-containing protein [unclassified Methylobacterium]|uniref:DUF3761 domain-containing protein n=1 Tax=unclassified Methylobacterium TaxID=2615210 RepID=UPI0008EC6F4E|nr:MULTISPECIES: DUF3761 domain-containing protein [unclassified Methylobacterium]SFU96466.1 Protein of unknown function [Methylobacterium sp. UNCCL125]